MKEVEEPDDVETGARVVLVRSVMQERRFLELRRLLVKWTAPHVAELVCDLDADEQAVVFRVLPRDLAADTFEYLPLQDQEGLLQALGDQRVAAILDEMSPDDRTALLEELPGLATRRLLNLLSPEEREVARQLLGYPEESIGRLMTPDYVAIREEWDVAQVLAHIRKFGRDRETLNVLYVVDAEGHLIDDIRMREFLLVDPETKVSELMDNHFIALRAMDDQETAVGYFRKYDRVALPVTDSAGLLIGIVTIDDVLDVAEQEATEDIHKLGGTEALDEPYLTISLPMMLRKRAPWLVILLIAQMLTTAVMGYFEEEIASAIFLALFIPLIISSGGNSGSQAASLVTRALALGEVRLRDWWRIVRREFITGVGLGLILGIVGFVRVALWGIQFDLYEGHWFLVATTIGVAVFGVVLWGSLTGSALPLLLKRLGADPAASSAPFVATIVDVTGIAIYFTVAALVLRGTLL
ncbi:MAG TPA: magnesium transporter [Thermoanaerobaculia bacterium]